MKDALIWNKGECTVKIDVYIYMKERDEEFQLHEMERDKKRPLTLEPKLLMIIFGTINPYPRTIACKIKLVTIL